MAEVFLGIGSNLGLRELNCSSSIELLEKRGFIVRARSSLYETEPWGVADQPKFINMAVHITTGLPPREVLRRLKEIEREMGRTETLRWGPRIIDLDILLYDNLVLNESDLVIPHPRMHEREFVLKPLSEIAPDTVHPVTGKTIKKLLAELKIF